SDNRVCLTLADTVGDVLTFRAGLGTLVNGVATEGRMIRFDDNRGGRARKSGILLKQDPTSFATSQISGNYSLGVVGVDSSGGRIAGAGVFTANAGVLSNGTADFDDAGIASGNVTGRTGTYAVATNGRGTASTTITVLGKTS